MLLFVVLRRGIRFVIICLLILIKLGILGSIVLRGNLRILLVLVHVICSNVVWSSVNAVHSWMITLSWTVRIVHIILVHMLACMRISIGSWPSLVTWSQSKVARWILSLVLWSLMHVRTVSSVMKRLWMMVRMHTIWRVISWMSSRMHRKITMRIVSMIWLIVLHTMG